MIRFPLTVSLVVFFFTTFSGCSVLGIRSGYEQLDYTVVDTMDGAEVRHYPPRVVAQVDGMKDDNESFRLLFRYISGENSSDANVAMTTPVQVEKASTEIAMTTPVEISKATNESVSMRFFLPRSFTPESAPKPTDSRIRILGLPAETYAAVTYSGARSEERFRLESERLMEILAISKWKSISTPSFLGYDPPFAIPFLRRNEAIVKVESR